MTDSVEAVSHLPVFEHDAPGNRRTGEQAHGRTGEQANRRTGESKVRSFSAERMNYSIRRGTAEDAGSIAGLLNTIIDAGVYTIMTESITVDDQADWIRSFPERGVFNVAVSSDDGTVLGLQDVVSASPDVRTFSHVGEISTFVSLSALRSGIGRRLSQRTFAAASELGFEKLTATIRADNAGALAFYQSQGFEIAGKLRKHALVQGGYVDEVLTEKFL